MKRDRLLYGIGAAVLLSLLLVMFGIGGGWVATIGGFILVVGGTLLAAVASQSFERVQNVLLKAPRYFEQRDPLQSHKRDIEVFLTVAEWNRRGNVRVADQTAKTIHDAFLRKGVQMVLDRTPQREMLRTLQWRIGNEQEQDQREIRVIRAMAGYAPALGMLGTLLGLVHMLFGLADKALGEVGVAMGFAMLTTVYGLIGANLLLKPLAGKMEQQCRNRISWMYAQLEAVLMLQERSHTVHIREALETYLDGRREPVAMPFSPRLRLMRTKTKAA